MIRFVGTSDDFTLMYTMKIVQKGVAADLIRVLRVEKGFSNGVKGVDDKVQTPLPIRTY